MSFNKVIQIRIRYLLFENLNNQIKAILNKNKKIIFFDEINTNKNVNGLLKEILVDRNIQG